MADGFLVLGVLLTTICATVCMTLLFLNLSGRILFKGYKTYSFVLAGGFLAMLAAGNLVSQLFKLVLNT
jgi:hypothetical protein